MFYMFCFFSVESVQYVKPVCYDATLDLMFLMLHLNLYDATLDLMNLYDATLDPMNLYDAHTHIEPDASVVYTELSTYTYGTLVGNSVPSCRII
jgi:hypothetical protein